MANLTKQSSKDARKRHYAAVKRSEARLAERIRNKQLTDHEHADPQYYNSIERELRDTLAEFAIDTTPDRTRISWRGSDGIRYVVQEETRPGVLLRVWRSEVPVEF